MNTLREPGGMQDLDQDTLKKWNEKISEIFADEIVKTMKITDPAQPRAWIYDPVAGNLTGTTTADISWIAFPKQYPGKYSEVDNNRALQEEYCEWEVTRGADGKVVRITFTTETEDYYKFLWDHKRDKLLELYQKHVNAAVVESDFVLGNNPGYNEENTWNWPSNRRGTIMHMAQTNNTLVAAINLSAFASWPVVNGLGVPVTAEQALIRCLGFGVAGRHSDPHIGAQINALVRAGNDVTFADPPGLYIDSIDLSEFETPDGRPADELFRVTRGKDDFMMRVIFEAPPTSPFVLGDVTIADRKIRFGGQVAEKLRIRIRGASRPSEVAPPNLVCSNAMAVVAAAVAGPTISPPSLETLATSRRFTEVAAPSSE
jgi:hypothetical protein